jgi:putative SOS response-associated peptidase YedK
MLAAVGHARRHRHSIKRRSTLFPSTGFRRPSRLQKRKAVKSAAFIEDSDEETMGHSLRLRGHAEHESGDDGLG